MRTRAYIVPQTSGASLAMSPTRPSCTALAGLVDLDPTVTTKTKYIGAWLKVLFWVLAAECCQPLGIPADCNMAEVACSPGKQRGE